MVIFKPKAYHVCYEAQPIISGILVTTKQQMSDVGCNKFYKQQNINKMSTTNANDKTTPLHCYYHCYCCCYCYCCFVVTLFKDAGRRGYTPPPHFLTKNPKANNY